MKAISSVISASFKAIAALSLLCFCQQAFAQEISSSAETQSAPATIMLRDANPGAQPIYIIDKQAKTLEELRAMSPEDITSVYVLKGIEAMAYGRVGENGIVTIVPKTIKIDSTNPKAFDIPGTYIKVVKKPAVFVDDVKAKYSKVKNILKDAEDYFYLRPEIAVPFYGKDGKNGVLVVKSKTKK